MLLVWLSLLMSPSSAAIQPAKGADPVDAFAPGRHRGGTDVAGDPGARPAAALDALVLRADLVLMDLRSLQACNAGCAHALGAAPRAAATIGAAQAAPRTP
jgi:hypothetical protein